MDKTHLALYHSLTDRRGYFYQNRWQAEIDNLPKKLEAQKEKQLGIDEGRLGKRAEHYAREAIIKALNGKMDKNKAMEIYENVYGKNN